MIKLSDIKKAKNSFPKEIIKETPLEYSHRLSKEYGANIYLKREDLQLVRSYKIRGAFNFINSLSQKEQEKGVVCASAGNHAQGVALTCNYLKIEGTIYMPITTPEQKVYKTKKFGGDYVNVVLTGDTFDEALEGAKHFEKKQGAIFVHPFDDERIITGQASIALEIFEQTDKDIDYIIVPIGGGGLISGIINVVSQLSPDTKIIGVEPEGAPACKYSLKIGENKSLHKIDTFVDGASVKKIGENTFKYIKESNIEVFLSPENRLCSTILEYLKEDGLVVEPAGALTADILKTQEVKDKIKGKNVVLIVSGSNFDFERLPEVKERSLKYEGLKRYLVVSFPQRPGALKEFLDFLGEHDDITRFEYLKKSNKDRAPVLIGIQTNDPKNFDKMFEKMKKAGINYNDITHNEIYFDLLI